MNGSTPARLIWVDATSGVPVVFGIITSSLTAALAATVARGSLSGGPGDPLNLLLTVSMYTSAISLAGGAAHAGSIARKGLLDLAAVTGRGRWAPVRVAMWSSASWAVATQLVGFAIVMLRMTSGTSSPWVWLLGAQALVLPVAMAAVGSALGARFSAAPVAAALALATLAWFYGFSYAEGALRKLSPVYPEIFYSEPVTEPNHRLLIGQIMVFGALAAAAVASVSKAGLRRALTLAAAAAGALGLGLLVTASAEGTQYPTHVNPVCREEAQTTLCVFPEYTARLADNLTALNDVRRAVGAYLETPSAFRQYGLPASNASVTYAGVYAVDPDDRITGAVDAILPAQVCATDQAAISAAVDLSRWARALSGHPDPYAEGPDYSSWTPAQNRSWVAAQLAALRRPC